MAKFTRRGFLKVMSVIATGAVGTVAFDRLVLDRPLTFDTESGVLDTLTSDTLEAFTGSVFAPYPMTDLSRYGRFFRFRAQNTISDLGLYTESASIIDAQANTDFGRSYLNLNDEERRAIVETLLPLYSQPIRVTRRTRVIHAFTAQIVDYYMHTDAYFIVHNEGYPGMARGFENYRQPLQDNV